MKYNKFYSDIDELLEHISSIQKLRFKSSEDALDKVIDDLSENELSETELELAAAAGVEIQVPDYIKNNKNM